MKPRQKIISIQEYNELLIRKKLEEINASSRDKNSPEKPQERHTEVLMRKTTNTTKRTKKLLKR